MAQNEFDSKVSEHWLVDPNPGIDVLSVDQQLISSENKASSVLQKDNREVSSINMEKQGSLVDSPTVSVPKRTTSGSFMSQPPSSNSKKGSLVYARRKPEDRVKRYICDNKDNNPDLPKLGDSSETKQEISERGTLVHGHKASATIPVVPLKTNLTGGPSLSLFRGKSVSAPSSIDLNHHPLTSVVAPPNSRKTNDHSSRKGYEMMLRSLSAAGRDKYAVELEKRAISLSLEEDRELQRMEVLNIFGSSLFKNNDLASSVQAPLRNKKNPPGKDQ